VGRDGVGVEPGPAHCRDERAVLVAIIQRRQRPPRPGRCPRPVGQDAPNFQSSGNAQVVQQLLADGPFRSALRSVAQAVPTAPAPGSATGRASLSIIPAGGTTCKARVTRQAGLSGGRTGSPRAGLELAAGPRPVGVDGTGRSRRPRRRRRLAAGRATGRRGAGCPGASGRASGPRAGPRRRIRPASAPVSWM